MYYFNIFATIQSKESIAKLWHMKQCCDTIHIATKNETKQDTIVTKRSLLINPTLNKQVQEVLVFVHCVVRFILIMTFIVMNDNELQLRMRKTMTLSFFNSVSLP